MPGFDLRAASQAELIVEFVERLQLKDLIMIGQDWGGTIGQNLAIGNPGNIKGIALGNTWGWPLKGQTRFEIFSWINGAIIGRTMAYLFNGVWRFLCDLVFTTKFQKKLCTCMPCLSKKEVSGNRPLFFPEN
nr:alpha/beta fold hydrolase [uncultured Allomuricauda sp.]